MNQFKRFVDLDAWKAARALKNRIWKLIKDFPSDEKFRLVDQIIRSSRSITALIAEGHGKYSYKDQINYCVMARGSLNETLNHLIDAMDCEYITKEDLTAFNAEIEKTGKLINGYISFLRKNLL